MLRTDVEASDAATGPADAPATATPVVAITAGLKALLAAASGLLLTCGLSLVVWAVTPSSSSGPLVLLRAGVAAFSAANGMTVTIGRAALTLPPLMITVVAIALLTSVSGRGRVIARGRHQELVATLVAAVTYAIAVAGSGAALGSRGSIRAEQWWRPALLALVVIGCTTLARGDGWRTYLLQRLPPWVPVAVRLGVAGSAVLIGGGAVTLLIGLVRSFNESTAVQSLAAPGAAGGFGMALLSIAYLPNAVIAGLGYSAGVGFSVGSGTYSPFGSSPVELPAIPLLTAAPAGAGLARPTLLLLLFPLLAAVLIGRGVIRRLDERNERLLAAVSAALLSAVVLALIAAAAAGGVVGGQWSSSGVPALSLGLVIAVGVGAVAAAVAAVARVPIAARVRLDQPAADIDEPAADADPGADSDVVAVADADQGADADDETVADEAVDADDVMDADDVTVVHDVADATDVAAADGIAAAGAAPEELGGPVEPSEPISPVSVSDMSVSGVAGSAASDSAGSDSAASDSAASGSAVSDSAASSSAGSAGPGSAVSETAVPDTVSETAGPVEDRLREEDQIIGADEELRDQRKDAQMLAELARRSSPRQAG